MISNTKFFSKNNTKNYDEQQKLYSTEEWKQFVDSTGFFRPLKNETTTTTNENIDEDFYNIVQKNLDLRTKLNRLFDEKKMKILNEANLNCENDNNILTSEQMFEKQKQTYDNYQQLMETIKEFINKRNLICDEMKELQKEIDNLCKKRQQLMKITDETRNVIRSKTSKIHFRSHNNKIIAMIFNNDGQLQDFLIENKENTTKENFWLDFCEKLFN